MSFTFLGHCPDGRVDLRLIPSIPLNRFYTIRPETPCGEAFLAKILHGDPIIEVGKAMALLRLDLLDWGLRYEVDWSQVVSIIPD